MGKGSRTVCSNHRPISLLSVPGKVFVHVLMDCLQPFLARQQRPQQSGFMRTRSTVDAILALCLLAELHREFGKPLQVAYIDIKAVFDSVDRQALWKALHATTFPDPADPRPSHRHNVTSPSQEEAVKSILYFLWRAARVHSRPRIILSGSFMSRCSMQHSRHYTWWCSVHRPWLCRWCRTFYTRLRKVAGRSQAFRRSSNHHAPAHFMGKVQIFQNIGHSPSPQSVSVDGHPVAVTDQFVYLGSIVGSTGYSSTDILRRVGLASSVMGQLDRVWRQNRLSLAIRNWGSTLHASWQ